VREPPPYEMEADTSVTRAQFGAATPPPLIRVIAGGGRLLCGPGRRGADIALFSA